MKFTRTRGCAFGVTRMLAKLLRSMKKRFSGNFGKQVQTLKRFRTDCVKRFGNNAPILDDIDGEIRYIRLRWLFGSSFLNQFGVKRGHPFSLIAKYHGIDIEAARGGGDTETGIVVCGLAFPKPQNPRDEKILRGESDAIVVPWFLRRNIPDFDRWYEAFYFLRGEGPYEFGGVSLAEGDVVLDCGANMGLFSAVASRDGCRVYAFEAIPPVIENHLAKTAALHPNISIQPFAVWDREEMLTFGYDAGSIDAASAVIRREQKEAVTVPAVRLDDWAEREGVTRVDFIKADIEGAERNLLRGAERILKTFAPKLSLCTYHLPDDPEVLRELILRANPDYVVTERFRKLYAHVPGRGHPAVS